MRRVSVNCLAILVYSVVLIALVFGIRHAVLVSLRMPPNEPPWYERGGYLPQLPYRVVVGPVDATRGIKGVLELGMTKGALSKALGRPLVEARSMTAETWLDDEHKELSNEFYEGVFAWVRYGENKRVVSITFNLAALRERLHATQVVVISHRGKTFVVDQSLRKAQVLCLLKRAQFPIEFDPVLNGVAIKGTGLSFNFNSQGSKLQEVSLTSWVY